MYKKNRISMQHTLKQSHCYSWDKQDKLNNIPMYPKKKKNFTFPGNIDLRMLRQAKKHPQMQKKIAFPTKIWSAKNLQSPKNRPPRGQWWRSRARCSCTQSDPTLARHSLQHNKQTHKHTDQSIDTPIETISKQGRGRRSGDLGSECGRRRAGGVRRRWRNRRRRRRPRSPTATWAVVAGGRSAAEKMRRWSGICVRPRSYRFGYTLTWMGRMQATSGGT